MGLPPFSSRILAALGMAFRRVNDAWRKNSSVVDAGVLSSNHGSTKYDNHMILTLAGLVVRSSRLEF